MTAALTAKKMSRVKTGGLEWSLSNSFANRVEWNDLIKTERIITAATTLPVVR